MPNQVAKERLYLTADKKRLVAEGDPKGATLYAAPGDEIPEEAAKRFGLVDGGLKGASPKGRGPADNKERKPEGDKSSTPERGGDQGGKNPGASATTKS